MSVNTYSTTTTTGTRYFFDVNGEIISSVGKKGGTFSGGQQSTCRISCFMLTDDYKDGARAHVMQYQFTTPSNVTEIKFKNVEWTGAFGFVSNSITEKSKPRCLITTNPLPSEYLDIWNQGKQVYFSGNRAYTTDASLIYNNTLTKFGDSLEPNQTYYIYVFNSFTYPAGYGQQDFATTNCVITVEETLYEKTDTPTFQTTSLGRLIPNSTYTIKWNKVGDKTNNKVEGYTLNWKIGTKTGIVTTNSTTYQASIQIPTGNTYRGKTLQCQLVVNTSASGYGSESAWRDFDRVNQLPPTPSFSSTSTVISSVTSTIQIPFKSQPSKDDDGDQIKIRYRLEGSNVYMDYSSNLVVSNSSGKYVYYFYFYDGYEYSQASTYTVNKNSKPTLTTSVTASTIDGYTISPTINVNPNNTTFGSSNKYNYYLNVIGKGQISLATNLSSSSYSISDIRLQSGIEPGDSYSFSVIRNDGIENSETVTTSTYKVPPKPSYNIKSANKIDEEYYFDNKLSFQCDNLYFVNSAEISVNNIKETIVFSQDTLAFSTSLLNGFIRGALTDVVIRLKYNDKILTNYTSTIRKIARILKNNEVITGLEFDSFNPFESPSTLRMQNVWDIKGFYKQAGLIGNPLDTNSGKTFKIRFQKANNISTGFEVEFNKADKVSNDSILLYKLAKEDVFQQLLELGLNQNINHNLSIIISFETDLDSTSSATKNFTADYTIFKDNDYKHGFKFVEEPTLTALTKQEIAHSLTSWEFLKEGMTIYSNQIVFSTYHTGIRVQYQISRKGGTFENYGPVLTPASYGPSRNGEPQKITIGGKSLATIGEILQDYNISFQIIVYTDAMPAGQSFEIFNGKSLEVQRHIIPSISIISGKYIAPPEQASTGKIEISYGLSNIDNTQISKTVMINGTKWEGVITDTDNVLKFDYTFPTNAPSVPIYVKIVSTYGTYLINSPGDKEFVTEKESKTETILIFNISPTVSYRKNRLGINTNADNDPNSIIRIAPGASGAKLITLETSQIDKNNKPLVCEIDLSDGSLKNFRFVIDCGTWD